MEQRKNILFTLLQISGGVQPNFLRKWGGDSRVHASPPMSNISNSIQPLPWTNTAYVATHIDLKLKNCMETVNYRKNVTEICLFVITTHSYRQHNYRK